MHSELAGVEYNHKKHVRLVTPDGMAERGRRVGGINRNVESYAYKAAGIHERKLSCLCCGCFDTFFLLNVFTEAKMYSYTLYHLLKWQCSAFKSSSHHIDPHICIEKIFLLSP